MAWPKSDSESTNGSAAASGGELYIIGELHNQFLESPFDAFARLADELTNRVAPDIAAIAAIHVALDLIARKRHEGEFRWMRTTLKRDLIPALNSHRRRHRRRENAGGKSNKPRDRGVAPPAEPTGL